MTTTPLRTGRRYTATYINPSTGRPLTFACKALDVHPRTATVLDLDAECEFLLHRISDGGWAMTDGTILTFEGRA